MCEDIESTELPSPRTGRDARVSTWGGTKAENTCFIHTQDQWVWREHITGYEGSHNPCALLLNKCSDYFLASLPVGVSPVSSMNESSERGTCWSKLPSSHHPL